MLITTHHSPLTTHHSSLTIHYSLLNYSLVTCYLLRHYDLLTLITTYTNGQVVFAQRLQRSALLELEVLRLPPAGLSFGVMQEAPGPHAMK